MKPPLSCLASPSLQMWILLDPVGSRADPAQPSPLKFTKALYETTTFAPRPAIAPKVDPPASRRILLSKLTDAIYETTTFVPGPTIAPNVDPPGSRLILRGSRSAFPS